MAYNGLAWSKVEIPFAAGLAQKFDDRARPQPFLDLCRDAQFDEMLGLQPRLPFEAMSNSILGGGTLSNCRRLLVYGDELAVLTKDSLYSWNSEIGKWILRGTHLAVAVDHRQRAATNGDQTGCDRAELNGTIVYTWAEGTGLIWVAAFSKATGAVLMPPTSVAGLQSRVVALSTKILFFLHETPTQNLTVRALDPAAPATGFAAAATSIVASNMRATFDVVRVLGADQAVGACQMATTTTYTAFTVTAGLTVATSLKARTADGNRIAVASRPSAGAQTHVFRVVVGTTAVVGDVLTTSTLADVTVNQAIGTYTGAPFNFLTACYRSVQTSGHFVCVVFWNAQFSATPLVAFDCKTNTVDDAGTIGVQATFVAGLTVASRAFDYAGSVYVHMLFSMLNATSAGAGAQLNSQYLLYREDRTLHAKAVAPSAGTHELASGVRPGVSSVDGSTFSWAGSFRRIASEPPTPSSGLAVSKTFGARSLVDIAIAFDSNAARRGAALGRTMYIAAGEVLQYDGVRLVELGFNVFQYGLDLADGGAATGSMAAGTYSYTSTFGYTNSQGEVERSTGGAFEDVVVAAGTSSVTSVGGVIGPLFTTRKTATPPSVEVWRTVANAGPESSSYLVSSLDPTALTNPNRFLPNSFSGIAAFVDGLADASITDNVGNPENGSALERLAPPGAKIIIATDTRLFLAGVAGDPDRIWYSRERGSDELAAFHDGLTINVPRAGGDITSIAFLDETLFAFRETAIYALPGVGFDNFGGGQNFGPARIVSLDIGAVSHETVAWTPMGLIFKSSKGWHLLHGNGQLEYIGDKVSDFDAEAVYAVNVVETQHHVRILTSGRMLIWDYRTGEWGEWTVTDGLHACMFNGAHVYLTATGPRTQQTSYGTTSYGLDVAVAPIKLSGLQGSCAVRRVQPLGEQRSAHRLLVRISYNYEATVVDRKAWLPSPTTVGGPLQLTHGPKRPRCQAIKVRLTAICATLQPTNDGGVNQFKVLVTGATWTAFLGARRGGASLDIALAFTGPPSIEVRDDQMWNGSAWVSAPGTCGVLLHDIIGSETTTIAQLEAALDTSALVVVVTPDPTGGVIDFGNSDSTLTVTFGDLGEGLKLTNLGLEVGTEPGLLRRLPAAQQQ